MFGLYMYSKLTFPFNFSPNRQSSAAGADARRASVQRAQIGRAARDETIANSRGERHRFGRGHQVGSGEATAVAAVVDTGQIEESRRGLKANCRLQSPGNYILCPKIETWISSVDVIKMALNVHTSSKSYNTTLSRHYS